jgi:hypothetical protein
MLMQKPSPSVASHLGSFVLSILLVLCIFLMAVQSFAATSPELEEGFKDGKIEVVYPADRLVPYRERRSNWGFTFGIQNEEMYPGSFKSQYDEFDYESMFGSSPIYLTQGQIGIKYNFSLGSIGASAVLGAGSVYDTRIRYQYAGTPDIDSELQLTKMGAAFTYTMDALFGEPYVAPYIEAQVFQLQWQESSKGLESKKGTTNFATALTVGALFQLNWLDEASAFEAQKSSGLENTYLDLFFTQYQASTGSGDPNFETDFNFGAGLRFEF